MIFYTHECEEKIGYSFVNKLLLRTCFTHTSYANEHNEESNEKLEFLGDSILNFTVAEYLFKAKGGDEGDMTKRRAELVSTEPIGEAVRRMELENFLLLGEGEKNKTPKINMCADLFEAIVAGIYLDGGLEKAKKFIYDKLLNCKSKDKREVDNKTRLQEFVQAAKIGSIEYSLLNKSGPDHAPIFTSAIKINGKTISEGVGKSKKASEQDAAAKAYVIMLEFANNKQKESRKSPAKKEGDNNKKINGKNGLKGKDFNRSETDNKQRKSKKGVN